MRRSSADQSRRPAFQTGQLFGAGLWGSRKTRPDAWATCAEMTDGVPQASEHAGVTITLDL